MSRTLHSARITGPVTCAAPGGRQLKIALGPCLAEQCGGHSVDLIGGAKGQNSTAFETAEGSDRLVLLD